jgi:glucan phosphoethanolaminetransferase (alkaline phosphatase superfamily)
MKMKLCKRICRFFLRPALKRIGEEDRSTQAVIGSIWVYISTIITVCCLLFFPFSWGWVVFFFLTVPPAVAMVMFLFTAVVSAGSWAVSFMLETAWKVLWCVYDWSESPEDS